jgi:pyruvate formate lyase activating enzyme
MKRLLIFCVLPIAIAAAGLVLAAAPEKEKKENSGEAAFYQKLEGKKAVCGLCPRRCVIPDGKRGFCRNRENRGGTLYSLTYGKPCAMGLEPIEKAPLYHFNPGHTRFVVAAAGCNFRCKHCQNWSISQKSVEEVPYQRVSPEEVVAMALREKAYSICFTFTEPISYYEYMYDIAKLAHEKGLKTAVVSNGYINPEPLKKLLTVLDAVKIDLKGFTEKFYNETCSAELEPVKKTIKLVKQRGKWLEIVNLVIPTLNDDPADLKKMCEWIKKEVGPDVPVHFTRFSPAYLLTGIPPTPIETLERAYDIAKKAGLNYVYVGNVPGHPRNSTFCPVCGKILIKRIQFMVTENNVKKGKCAFCGAPIAMWHE